jgi:glycosyltransferase involved in cell wall biosynthesis
MNALDVSVIMPVYNATRYLREAIDSVLGQSVPPRQFIVVDDGSTDDSLRIASSYGSVLTVIAQANAGTAAARNRGLAEADQPLIAFLDNDDRFLPAKLELQARRLAADPQAMLCLCRARAFWSPEVAEGARRSADLTPQFRPGQPSTWLARREVFERVGGFNTGPESCFIEGTELYLRIEHAGCKVAKLDETLLDRRLSLSNKTADTRGHLDGIMRVMKYRLDLRRRSS